MADAQGSTADVPFGGPELLAFVVAVETGSIAAAADALNLTASAVTKRIQLLERRADVRLLERGAQGVSTTEAGRLLYPEARAAVTALRRAREVVARHADPGSHPIRLAASHTIGECLLPEWLAAYRSEQPGARIQLDVVNSREVRRRVAAGEIDLGFVEDGRTDPALAEVPLLRDEIMVVVDAAHAWAELDVVAPSALAGEPYLTREDGSGTRAVAEAAFATAGIILTPALEVASLQALGRALGHGGFALLSALAVEPAAGAGRLRAIPIDGLRIRRTLTAVAATVPQHGDHARLWTWLARRGPA